MAQNPRTGKFDRAKEAALGAQFAAEVRKASKPLDSPLVGKYVERIGQELAAGLPVVGPVFTFDVLAGPGGPTHEPVALPGGYIFIPTGLLLAAESEAEFAGMLAHASAHSAAHRGAREATAGHGIPVIFMGGWSNLGVFPVGFMNVMRGVELEADRIALQTVSSAGYDPTGLLDYIERVQIDDDREPYLPLPIRATRLAGLKRAIAESPPRDYASGTGEFERVQDEVRALTEKPRRAPSLR